MVAENKDTYIGTKQYYFLGPTIQMSNHDALENVSKKKVYIVFIKMFVLVKINLPQNLDLQ
jgi:hypothetical protein